MRPAYLILGVFILAGSLAAYSLRPKEARDDSVILASTTPAMTNVFSISSPAFPDNGMIPAKYTCDGDGALSPPLVISEIPKVAKSLALIMDDPDIPDVVRKARNESAFDHWILFNLPAGERTLRIEEGQVPKGAVPGANSAGGNAYTGPCPPREYEPSEHRYIFKLYALMEPLALPAGAKKGEVMDALAPLVVAEAELVGRYSRK